MAKPKETNSFGKGPWVMKKEALKNFSLITPANWTNAKVLGRILYVIEPLGHNYRFCGTITLDPCFTKGWILYPWKPWQNSKESHFKIFIPEDMDFNEATRANRGIIDKCIEKGTLYIKQSDPILTYLKP